MHARSHSCRRDGRADATSPPRRAVDRRKHRAGPCATGGLGRGPRRRTGSAARCPRTAGRARHRAAPAAAGRRGRGCPPAAPRGGRPARRLRPAATAPAGCAAARRGGRADRGRQVDAGEQPGRPAGQRLRCAAPDDPVRGARPTTPATTSGSRSSGCFPASAGPPTSSTDPTALQLVPSEGIPAGLAVLDAPDIDSVVTRNRELATQLLAAADMWLFVTTAARYADAVPWEFLREAVTRGTAVAVVLDRVAPEATEEVRGHLAAMLTENGLGEAPLFVVHETAAYDAMLPPDVIDPMRTWLLQHRRRTPPCGRPWCGTPSTARSARWAPGSSCSRRPRTRRPRRRVRLRREVDTAYDGGLELVDVASRGRLPAARRGAGSLAGVRRHRGADAGAGVEGVAAARPGDRRRQGKAATGRGPGRGARVGRGGAGAVGRGHRGRAGRHGVGRRPRRRPAPRRRRPAPQLARARRRDRAGRPRLAVRRGGARAHPGAEQAVHRALPRPRRERAWA